MSKVLEQEANKVGAAVARALFKSRGNNSEIHLRETQLAELCSLAYQSGYMAAAKAALEVQSKAPLSAKEEAKSYAAKRLSSR